MFRNQKEVYDRLELNLYPLDWFLHILNSEYGKIKFLPFESAVYRKHDGGICSATSPIINNQKYLFNILYSKSGEELLKLNVTGTAQGGLNRKNLLNIQI